MTRSQDRDTQNVVTRIGQIALQGRKYGVGLLVVSQRTALVSKTILSQCHTFLIHALIDQTSLDFLQNVIGREYIKAIPNLMPLQLIAAGKAVHSERPTLTQREWSDEKFAASERLNRPEPEVLPNQDEVLEAMAEAAEAGVAGADTEYADLAAAVADEVPASDVIVAGDGDSSSTDDGV